MAEGGSQQRKPDFKTAVEDVKAIATVPAMEAGAILGRRTARVLGILVLFAVVVGVLLAHLNWYIAPSGAAQKKDVVATLAQILGGAALLAGLYFTRRTLQVNREGLITERFTRAINQLGQERVVTTFYYYEGLTLREIGGMLNLTEGRISQILRAIVIRLRRSLSDAFYLLEGCRRPETHSA